MSDGPKGFYMPDTHGPAVKGIQLENKLGLIVGK